MKCTIRRRHYRNNRRYRHYHTCHSRRPFRTTIRPVSSATPPHCHRHTINAPSVIHRRCYNRRHRTCSTRFRRRRRFRRSATVAVAVADCTAGIVVPGTATIAIASSFIFASSDCCDDSHVVIISPQPQVRVSATGHTNGGRAWSLCIHCCMHVYSHTHMLTTHAAICTRRDYWWRPQ